MNTSKDVLGNEREITQRWADGSFACPFCTYPVTGTHCCNPWCVANPTMSAATAAELYAERAKKAEAEERAKRDRESIAAFHREQRDAHAAWRAEQTAECERRGACVRCLFQPGWQRAKFVRHRGKCPKEKF